MNKEELKAKLTKLIDKKGNYNAYSLNSKQRIHAVGIFEGLTEALKLIDRLDEPELPVIPQFVANHIEGSKQMGKRLNIALSESPETEMILQMNITIFETNNIYARAWLDGYTIEPQPIKTRQVLVKFFDNEEYKTELTEDAARDLIEFLEANKK